MAHFVYIFFFCVFDIQPNVIVPNASCNRSQWRWHTYCGLYCEKRQTKERETAIRIRYLDIFPTMLWTFPKIGTVTQSFLLQFLVILFSSVCHSNNILLFGYLFISFFVFFCLLLARFICACFISSCNLAYRSISLNAPNRLGIRSGLLLVSIERICGIAVSLP